MNYINKNYVDELYVLYVFVRLVIEIKVERSVLKEFWFVL